MAASVTAVGVPPGVSSGTPAADLVTITVGDNWFCDPSFFGGDCQVTIAAGDMAVWEYAVGSTVHDSTECGMSCDAPTGGPIWASSLMSPGDTFAWTFDTAGTFHYYCSVHPFDMRGTIVVESAPESTPMTAPEPQPPTIEAPIDTPAADDPRAGAPASVPATGGPAPAGDGARLKTLAALLSGGVLAGAGVAVFVLRRRIDSEHSNTSTH